jgi:hypothetical protein
MNKFLFFTLVFIIANNTYTQTYFNFRFEYEQTGIWDGASNVFLLSDGYVLAGGTGTGINNDSPRIGFYKVDFVGNKIFSKVFGGTMCFLGNPGSIIRFNDTLIVACGSRKILQNMEYNEGLLLFMTNSFDTLFTKRYGDKVIPNDTCIILNQLKKVGSNQIITVGSRQLCGYFNKIVLLKTTDLVS